MNFCNFGKQFISIKLGKPVIRVNPADKLGHGDTNRVVHRAINSCSHNFLLVFKARPPGTLTFYKFKLEAYAHGNFHRAPRNFAITHGGVSVPKIKESAANTHWQ